MIKVECPHCSKKLSAPAEYSGRQVTCQRCKGKFVLPDLTAAAQAPQSQPQAPAPPVVQTGSPPQTAPAGMPSVFDAASPEKQSSGVYPQPPEPGVFGGISQAETERQREKRGMNSSMIEARNWGALFDFRFKKFLSPKILRVCWGVYLTLLAIWFCGITTIYVLGVIASLSIGLSSSAPILNAPMATTRLSAPATLSAPTTLVASRPQEDELDQLEDLMRQAQNQQGINFLNSNARRSTGLWGFLWLSCTYLLGLVGIFLALCLGRVAFESIHIFFSMADTLRGIEAAVQAN